MTERSNGVALATTSNGESPVSPRTTKKQKMDNGGKLAKAQNRLPPIVANTKFREDPYKDSKLMHFRLADYKKHLLQDLM